MSRAAHARRTIAAVVVLAFAATPLLAGCRGGSSPASASSRRGHSRTGAPRSTPTRSVDRCFGSSVRVTAQAGATHGNNVHTVTLSVTNTSSRTCALDRSPMTGLAAGTPGPQDDGLLVPGIGSRSRVTLSPGFSARATLTYQAPGAGVPGTPWNPTTVVLVLVGERVTVPWPGGPVVRLPGEHNSGATMNSFF
jgi:hypothetical protein